jgi:hypothetical protein
MSTEAKRTSPRQGEISTDCVTGGGDEVTNPLIHLVHLRLNSHKNTTCTSH